MSNMYIRAYLEYFNDFLTIEKYAEYYGIEADEARKIIERGRQEHYRGSGVLGNEPTL